MTTPSERTRRPKLIQNSLLVVAGLMALAPLIYQLPRWAKGLDPTFVHPKWIDASSFPLVLYMAKIHPVVWIVAVAVIFICICRNYGWRLER